MIGTWSANFHQGQRSCAPRKQAGHMSALNYLAETSKNLLHRRGRPHMGTTVSPWRYDGGAYRTPAEAGNCDRSRFHTMTSWVGFTIATRSRRCAERALDRTRTGTDFRSARDLRTTRCAAGVATLFGHRRLPRRTLWIRAQFPAPLACGRSQIQLVEGEFDPNILFLCELI